MEFDIVPGGSSQEEERNFDGEDGCADCQQRSPQQSWESLKIAPQIQRAGICQIYLLAVNGVNAAKTDAPNLTQI